MTEKKKIRLLLADDEPHVRLYVKSLMKTMGCEIVGEAGDGKRALELFDQVSPDLVLLDINMPVMDGITALKAMRQRSGKVAIVMLTSLASAEVVEQCLEAGATYHLRKDLPMGELKQEIKDMWVSHLQDLQS